jgi:hypothetical protein
MRATSGRATASARASASVRAIRRSWHVLVPFGRASPQTGS